MLRRTFIALACLSLAACQGVSPDKIAEKTQLVAPENARHAPVVVFYQGTGGGNRRALVWAEWFKRLGVASLIVDNAGARGLSRFSGTVDFSEDAFLALRSMRGDPRIDPDRYALMGFSRGGTQAMLAGWSRGKDIAPPDFVFAFYPGTDGVCSNSHGKETAVHVFYGDLDQWGAFNNTRDACARNAEGDPGMVFHLLKNAHHGFDDSVTATWGSSGQMFVSAPNPEATAEVKRIIEGLIASTWKTRR